MRIIAALGGHASGVTLLSRQLSLHALSGEAVNPGGTTLHLLDRDEQQELGVLTPAGTIKVSDVHVTLDPQGNSAAHVLGQPVPHVAYHSPTGMSHGYSGSGPSDLALSILNWFIPPLVSSGVAQDLDDLETLNLTAPAELQGVVDNYLHQQRQSLPSQPLAGRPEIIASRFALRWYQEFKAQFVASQQGQQPFVLNGNDLSTWINARLLDPQST